MWRKCGCLRCLANSLPFGSLLLATEPHGAQQPRNRPDKRTSRDNTKALLRLSRPKKVWAGVRAGRRAKAGDTVSRALQGGK